MQDLDRLKSELVASIAAADTLEALEALRVSVLGKKGRVSLMMLELGGMAPDEQDRGTGAEPGEGYSGCCHRCAQYRAVECCA